MTDQEILDALRRKLEYNRKCQHVNEREAKEAQARADLSARIMHSDGTGYQAFGSPNQSRLMIPLAGMKNGENITRPV